MKAIPLAALIAAVPVQVLAAGPFDGTWKIDVANVAPPTKPFQARGARRNTKASPTARSSLR